jgi:mono/diheme cytochrome c family protein
MKTRFLLVAILTLGASAARAQIDIATGGYPQKTGEALYKGVCQGCHMPDAKGAIGAGAYPALAANNHLQSAAYPALIIIGGHKAMPSFGADLTDAQVAGVVNYIRSNFGNHYTDAITPADVKSLRPSPNP